MVFQTWFGWHVADSPDGDPRKRSWGRHARFFHSFCFFNGVWAFLVESVYYIPTILSENKGAALFTYGSIWFVFGDFHDWYQHRIGCAFDSAEDRALLEKAGGGLFKHEPRTLAGIYERGGAGFVQFICVLGSVGYLVGSVLFFPELGHLILGAWVFIFASLVIVAAQTAKLLRGCPDPPAYFIEASTWLGAAGYFIGSVYLWDNIAKGGIMPAFLAADWFILGSVFYCLMWAGVTYRHFCYSGNPLPSPNDAVVGAATSVHEATPLI